MRYLDVEGRIPDAGVVLRESATLCSSDDIRPGFRRFPNVGEGEEAGKGVETPSALASFARRCGGRGERGARFAGGFRGEALADLGRFGIAGAVKGET